MEGGVENAQRPAVAAHYPCRDVAREDSALASNAQGRYSRARKVRPRVNARVNLGWCTLLQGSRGPSTDIPIGPSEGGGDS